MLEFDAIIIGGGLGGLTAGATLAKQGNKVLLLEQHYIVGGCATAFKRKDFLMEVGLHELDGLHEEDTKTQIFKFLGVDKNIEFLQIPDLFRLKTSQLDFIHPHGRDATVKALAERFPEEKQGITDFLDFMDEVTSEMVKVPQGRLKQKLMYPFFPLIFPALVKASRTNLSDWLDKHIVEDELKIILQAMLLYYHDDPYTMSMIYFSAAQSSYINGGGHFIKGGSQELSNYLKSVIEEHGGQVLVGKKVSNILVKGGKARGISFKDSFNDTIEPVNVYAKKIIANTAVPSVKSLLPQKESRKLARKIDHLEPACSLLTVYIGFKKEVKSLGNQHYSTFIFHDDVKTLTDIKENARQDWHHKNLVFVDYSQIDSGLAPEGKSVGVICTADYLCDWETLDEYAYAAKKEEVAQILIDRLEEKIPGLKAEIEYYEVGTSKTIQNYTLNPKGTPYGYAQTLKQSGLNRVGFHSPVKNLYFAGAWSFPGGGFTGAIISGFLCADTVNKTISKKQGYPTKIAEDRIVPLLSKREIAQDTIEISVAKPEGFQYEAGQYAVLEIMNPKREELDLPFRSLSMVSHCDEESVRFAMRSGDSSFKQNIENAQEGDLFCLYGPMGDFTLNDAAKSGKPKGVVFLISGIGITPILPFLEELKKRSFSEPVYLFYSNRTEEKTAYHDHFKAIDMPSFHYVPVFSKTMGRINEAMLQAELKDLTAFDYYLVGTKNFVENMENCLHDNSVAKSAIKSDSFG